MLEFVFSTKKLVSVSKILEHLQFSNQSEIKYNWINVSHKLLHYLSKD